MTKTLDEKVEQRNYPKQVHCDGWSLWEIYGH